MSGSADAVDSEATLAQLFDRCMSLCQEVRDATGPATDPELQSTVRAAIGSLEELTRRVSAAGLFSDNEAVHELATASLPFLLLPALLAELTVRLAHEDRLQVIGIAEVYYRDFLQRCRDYGLTEAEIPGPRGRGEDTGAPHAHQPRAPTMRDLATMSKQREERLRRYREQKELEKRLTELQEVMRRPCPDDDTLRDYHLTLLRQAVGKACAELQSLELEKPILQHMQQLKARGGGAAAEAAAAPAPTVAPLRPVVITRTKLEAAVFGAGYSSLPTMSVEEFYEQRVRDGVFPGGPAAPAVPAAGQPATAEDKDEQQERLEEVDDAASLTRARQWDEYRDDHKRGEGNRHNRS